MTREESVSILKTLIPKDSRGNGKVKTNIAITEAILNAVEALEQEPCEDCISRAEAMAEIQVNVRRYTLAKEFDGMGQVEWSDYLIPIKDTLDILRKLSSVKQEPKTEWIPVSERPPEDYETVIASVDHERVYPEARYSKEFGWKWAAKSSHDYWVDLNGVDAWMPLPKPYSEVER